MIGKTIGHYQIIEKIGEGGMGAVYKAEDTTLDRAVALKVLPPDLVQDDERRSRFQREAKTVAALNHPNIVTVHSVEESDGIHFITMEFVAGDPLSKLIPKKGYSIGKFFEIALPLIDAVSTAHDNGITHRDLKPDNIMQGEDRRVRLLDFGLAKLRKEITEDFVKSLDASSPITDEGMIIGTAAYMSPEQAVGKPADHRSDIFSLGVILYEMATGERPFEGDTNISILSSILKDTPPTVTQKNPKLPGHLGRIIKRCIAKDPARRYPTARGLYNDLVDLKEETETGEIISDDTTTAFTRRMGRRWIVPAVGVAASAIIIAGLLLISGIRRTPAVTNTLQLTASPGLEDDPTWSLDLTTVAYASDKNGNSDIWVHQVNTGRTINLTADNTGYDGKPVWSPDGDWIAFISDREGGGLFIISPLGGTPRRVTPLSFELSIFGYIPQLCWSPDSREIAYTIKKRLLKVSVDGGTPTEIISIPTSAVLSDPAWSPDGGRILFTDVSGFGTSLSTIWAIDPDGNNAVPITDGSSRDRNPQWSPDMKGIFYVSDRSGSSDVWWMPVNRQGNQSGKIEAVTNGAGVGSIALSGDGLRLAYSKVLDVSNIWSIPFIPDRELTLDEAESLTSENYTIEFMDISPDGEWITFDSNRSGNSDIWKMRPDGSDLQQLTRDQAHDFSPCWSPDGNRIVFYSLRSGNRDIWVMPADGGLPDQLTSDPGRDSYPTWSIDGSEIFFSSNRNGSRDIWSVSSEGGELKSIEPANSNFTDHLPIWSPDGMVLSFTSNREGTYAIYLLREGDGSVERLTGDEFMSISRLRWSPDSEWIIAIASGTIGIDHRTIWAISPRDGSARRLLELRGETRGPNFSISVTNDRIFFPLWNRTGSVYIADLSNY